MLSSGQQEGGGDLSLSRSIGRRCRYDRRRNSSRVETRRTTEKSNHRCYRWWLVLLFFLFLFSLLLLSSSSSSSSSSSTTKLVVARVAIVVHGTKRSTASLSCAAVHRCVSSSAEGESQGEHHCNVFSWVLFRHRSGLKIKLRGSQAKVVEEGEFERLSFPGYLSRYTPGILPNFLSDYFIDIFGYKDLKIISHKSTKISKIW